MSRQTCAHCGLPIGRLQDFYAIEGALTVHSPIGRSSRAALGDLGPYYVHMGCWQKVGPILGALAEALEKGL